MEIVKEDRITIALEKHGAFFAFSNSQFKEKQKDGVKYVSLGAGLICPKANAEQLIKDITLAGKEKIAEDKKINTNTEIIHRELANHEAQIRGDIDETVDALEGYGITRDEIQAEFEKYMEHCIEHDLF